MKGHLSFLFACLLVFSVSISTVGSAQADEDPGAGFGELLWGHQDGGDTDDGPPDGTLEGDPENWLGGQNSVVPPKTTSNDDGGSGGVITWISKLLVRLVSVFS